MKEPMVGDLFYYDEDRTIIALAIDVKQQKYGYVVDSLVMDKHGKIKTSTWCVSLETYNVFFFRGMHESTKIR